MKRRDFLRQLLVIAGQTALLGGLMSRDLLAAPVQPILERWLRQLHQQCLDLRRQELTEDEWRHRLDELFATVELSELVRFIDFEGLRTGLKFPDDQAATRPIRLPTLKGLPKRLSFYPKMFGLKKGRAIVPHAHDNMLSMHFVLRGELHLRQYDRIRDEPGHLLLRPTADGALGPGQGSSIGTAHDNVHWFIATTEEAFTFDVIVLGLDPAVTPDYRQHFLHPRASQVQADGLLRTPIITVEECISQYGRS